MPTSLPPGFVPPCNERGEQIAELKADQRVMASEFKSLKEANAVDHKRIEATLSDVQRDVKEVVTLLSGGGGGDGMNARLRRVEENCVKQADFETRLSSREVENAKANKTLIGVVVASGFAVITSLVTGIFTYLAEVASSGGGGTTP